MIAQRRRLLRETRAHAGRPELADVGAVLRPGKLMAERPLTVFEAVMEAGGPDFARANLKEVLLLRETTNGLTTSKFNLKAMLSGRSTTSYYVKPSDVIYVREKFSWF